MNQVPTFSAYGFTGTDWGGYSFMKQDARQEAGEARRFAHEERTQAQNWQESMAATAYQRSTKDLLAAGLNPMLAVNHGPASAPSASQGPHIPVRSYTAPSIGANAQIQTAAMAENLVADADKKGAEADAIRATTPVNIDRMKQDIKESIQKIETLKAAAQQSTSSAAEHDQRVINLQAEIPRIQADINRIMQEANRLVGQSFLLSAQEKEVQQRVKENLPQIERAIKEFEALARQMQQPRLMHDESVQNGFLGSLSAVIRALTGLGAHTNIGR